MQGKFVHIMHALREDILMNIIIRQLTPELNDDYLDFFDNRAFTDDNPNGPCYCTSPNQDEESIKQMLG